MREIERLMGLLQRVPFLAINVAAARARGDHDAIRYASAVERWQADAARMLDATPESPVERPDAFERCAVASRLGRLPAANLNDPAGMSA